MSHESVLQPYKQNNRGDVMEGGLGSQEQVLSVLLEQALRIRDEVASSLQTTQGSVLAEALSRRLLENHINTITHIVKQLSMDIQALESQISQRDSVTSGTSLAVKNLDQKNMAGIGDLRGRVARCDASIAKLSGDLSATGQQVIRLQQEVADLRSALDVRLKEMELKLYQVGSRLEASVTEQSQGQRSSMSDLHGQVKLMEARNSYLLNEARKETDKLRKWTEQQLHSSQKIQTQGSQQLLSLLQDKMVEVESRLSERLCALEVRVERCEAQQQQASHSQAERLRRCQTKLNSGIGSVENSLQQEMQLIKQDYQEGFRSVHDAIDSLRQIGDTKARLDREKHQKDIKHIRRKMVELRDL